MDLGFFGAKDPSMTTSQPAELFRIPIVVCLILKQHDQSHILLLRRTATLNKPEGLWSLPGGKVDANESLTQALKREAFEEINVTISEDDLELVHVMHAKTKDREWIAMYFVAEKWTGLVQNNEPNEHELVAWWPLHALPQDLFPPFKQALDAIDNNRRYSQFGW